MRSPAASAGIALFVGLLAPAAAQAEDDPALVARGAGVFVERDGGRLLLHGGGRWIPLERERYPRGVVLHRPRRPLEPGVVYQVVAVDDESGERARLGRVVAGAAADRVAPRWRRAPQILSAIAGAGCFGDRAVLDIAVAIEDESPVRVEVVASALDGSGEAHVATGRPIDGQVRVAWSGRGEALVRPGVEYAAALCAEDTAGHRACAADPIHFTAPEPGDTPLRPDWFDAEVERTEPEVVGAPPPADERMERGRVAAPRVDWLCAGAGAAGAALVLALAALVGARRAARAQISRAA